MQNSNPIRIFLECVKYQHDSLLRLNIHETPKPSDFLAGDFIDCLTEQRWQQQARFQLAIEAAQKARNNAQKWIDNHPSYWAISGCLLAAYDCHKIALAKLRDSDLLVSHEAEWTDAIAKLERWLAMIEEASLPPDYIQPDALPDRPLFTFTQPEEFDSPLDPQMEGEITAAPSVGASGKEPEIEGAEWIDKLRVRTYLGVGATALTKRIKNGTILREINGRKLGISHHRIQVVSEQLSIWESKWREKETRRLKQQAQRQQEKDSGRGSNPN